MPEIVDTRCEYLNWETPYQCLKQWTLGVSTLIGKPRVSTGNSGTMCEYLNWETPCQYLQRWILGVITLMENPLSVPVLGVSTLIGKPLVST